jgi:hypothetical protein
MIHSVLYVSAASHLLDRTELAEIIDLSRRNNARDGITGMLLYHDGSIMQVVEGPKASVLSLLERLRRDARHRRLIVILEADRPDREFGEWTMACVSSDDLPVEDRAALSHFFDEEHGAAASDAPTDCDSGMAMQLLRRFRETMDRFSGQGSVLGGGAASC